MVRLAPMSEAEFESSLERGLAESARDGIRRGRWTRAGALEASRAEFAQFLPAGFRTPHRHFRTIRDDRSGRRVGETWYTVQKAGGKVHFWVDWIWVDPRHRRRGYAAETLRQLAEEAARAGADRVGLYVEADNRPARSLYRKLGYRISGMRLHRPLRRRP